MAIGTVYCVKAFGTIYAQNMLNVYFYRQETDGVPSGALGLFDAFDNEVLAAWAQSVVDQVDIINLEVFSPFAPSDFQDGAPVNNKGDRAITIGERSPSYLAFGFKSNRAGPGSRSSFKRYCGLQEDNMDANSLNTAFTTNADIVALQAVLGEEIDDGLTGASYVPVQVKHPVTLFVAPVVNFDITNWGTAYLTSQVSRRPTAGT